jgi:hypothetical protein
MNNTAVYYVPAGYRYVKHVLIQIDTEAQSTITALDSELTTLNTTKTNLESALGIVPEGTEVDPAAATPAPTAEPSAEELAAQEESDTQMRAQLEQANADIAAKQTELDAAKKEAFDAILPKVEEVQAKIALGLNFDKIIESYGEDTGMSSEPFKTQGYPVTAGMTSYDQAFQDASMALANIGDISEPVQSQFGYHIIKYVADSEEHEVGLDAVRDDIQSTLLTTKQNETYDAKVQEWIAATTVKRHDGRMDFTL